MPIIGNNGRSLLHGLSDFWLRFFKDLGDIEATYEGAEILLGQTYLNLLSDVLNTSVAETPLFKKEYYRSFTIREDQVTYRDTGVPGAELFVIPTDVTYGALPYLQNKVFAPTAGYEQGLDYELDGTSLHFKADPTNPVLPGFANRDVDISITGTFAGGVDWLVAGVKKGDVLVVNAFYNVSVTGDPLGTLRFTVVKVEAGRLVLQAGGTLPASLAGYSWRLERTLTSGDLKPGMPSQALFTGVFTATTSIRVRAIALWAVDALVDDERLFYTYGHYFGEKRASSEAYRAFIRGLMQLYVFGPVVDRIESALNVMAALPVARDDGEVLTSYDNGLDDNGPDGVLGGNIFSSATAAFIQEDTGGFVEIVDAVNTVNIGTFQILSVTNSTTVLLDNEVFFIAETALTWEYSRTNKQTVTTSRTIYEYPRRIPMRADVVNPANFGVLTFQAFEALTTAAVVTDYIKDPEWWLNITLPKTILDRVSPVDRVASPQLLPNVVGPVGEFLIGDPGFYIGADEDGVVGGSNFHHRAAFILMDRFLKTHMVAVVISQYIDLTGQLIADMQKVLLDLKPVDATLYFQPITEFKDLITIVDNNLGVVPKMAIDVDQFNQVDNQFAIGSGWNVGDGWKFTGTSGGAITLGTGAGFVYVAIGGADPSVAPTSPATEPIAYYIDRPLYVNPRAP